MRLPYISNPPTDLSPAERNIVRRIEARRGNRGLLKLDLTLLHAPKIADGWHSFFGSIYSSPMLRTDLLEIAICRVAFLNEAWYQWDGHSASLRALHGFDSEKLKVIEMRDPVSRGPLTADQWAVLKYADAMTRTVVVHDEVFDELLEIGLCNQEIVELTASVAAYNAVSRFLVALDVGEKQSANDNTDNVQDSSCSVAE